MTDLPSDYSERAYAAVLGKLIGVYLGRPFENWTYQRIMRELGPIEDYVHDESAKLALLMANTFFTIVVGLAAAYGILKLSFGL